MKIKVYDVLFTIAMKLFVPITLVLSLTVTMYANTTTAQSVLDKEVSLSITNMELIRAIGKIQRQSGVKFIFSPNVIESQRRITCDVRSEKLGTFLEVVLLPLGVGYKVINERVVLFPITEVGEKASLSKTAAFRLVRGKIENDKGEPLAGASINVKGTSRYTTSDDRGEFSIEVDNDNAILIVSYTGFQFSEIEVGNSSQVSVKLRPLNLSMDEIVVVGYGEQRRATVTGAISRVSADEITAMPVVDARQALQGRVAGVSIVNNGSPGDAPIIRIRGIGSINYSSDPFFVIDGFPGGDLSMIDGNDIESIEVLRDASAAAIYGSRAANGVILVTTKKGTRNNKLQIELNSYYGIQMPWKKLDLLNTEQYIQYATALKQNAGATLPARFSNLDQPVHSGTSQTYRQTNTDWQEEMFRTAPITHHNISLQWGNDKSRYFTSAGFIKQDGIMLGTSYERYNIRFNSEHTISNVFSFGQSVAIATDNKLNENNAGGRSQLKHIIHSVPYIPVEDPTLPGGYRGPSGDDGSDPQNPVRVALQDLSRTSNLKVLGSAYLGVKLTRWLSYRFTAGINHSHSITRLNNPIYNESFNARPLNRVEQSQNTYRSLYLSNQLNFNQSFGRHNVGLTAVAERQSGRNRFLFGGGTYTTNELREVTNSMQDAGVNGGLNEEELISFLGRLNYDFDTKYLLSATFRRDGSSVWAPGKKWANFPSVSAGWRISNESFFQVPFISELKLRGSWGKMGFNGIGNYSWQPVLLQNGSAILADGQVPGAFFNALGNSELEWEITNMTNIGLDFSILNNRLAFQAEYYVRKTEGLILQSPLAPSLGFSVNTPANVGAMENKGFEFQATYYKKTGKLTFELSGNISTVSNKVLSFGENIKSPIFAGMNADFGGFDITRTQPGDVVQAFYGWKVDGIFQTQAEIDAANGKDNDPLTLYQAKAKPGDIRFRDINDDGVINADDRMILGSFIPDFSYGVNFTAKYNSFDATMFLQGVQGNKVYNGTKVLSQGMLRLFGASTDVLDAWTESNTNTNIPRAEDGDPNNNTRTSDRFLEDGSYMRIKVFSIGYNFKKSMLSKIAKGAISKARLYLSSQNLLTITNYSGYDPEIGSRFNAALTSGIDYGQFPQARTILVGLELGF
jgi:TonB-dependent starch-binding outer membrane protein SusC